ncbi:hypothetical protein WDW86_01185 [Bdellovibrionota bacterium FG-2]
MAAASQLSRAADTAQAEQTTPLARFTPIHSYPSAGENSTETAEIRACRDYNNVELQNSDLGFKCRTSKDAVFERVAAGKSYMAWKGQRHFLFRGLILKNMNPDGNQNERQSTAESYCSNAGGSLPSDDDFERADEDCFFEITRPKIHYGHKFWTSTDEQDRSPGTPLAKLL